MINFDNLDESLRRGDLNSVLVRIDNYLIEYQNDHATLLKLQYFKVKTLKLLENFEEGLELAKEIIKKSNNMIDQEIFFDSSLLMAEIYSRKGKIKESFKILDNIEKHIEIMKNITPSKKNRKLVELFLIKSTGFWRIGELGKAKEFIIKSQDIGKTIGDRYLNAKINYFYGTIQSEFGDLINGIEIYQNALKILTEYGDLIRISVLLNNIGWSYKIQGKLDLAIEYLKRSIDIRKKFANQRSIRVQMANIGIINWQKGNLNEALSYLKRSLQMEEEIGNQMEIVDCLFYLYTILLEQNNLDEANKYLDKIKQIDDAEKDNRRIHTKYEISFALMLKKKPRAKNIYQAQEILKNIIYSDVAQFEITIIALLNLCDLFLFELKSNNDEEILKEINKILQNLLLIAKTHNSYYLWAEIYFIQAKFSLIQLDIQKARYLLTKGQKLADSKGLNQLAMTISAEHDALLEKHHIWAALRESKLPISERINLAKIDPQMERLLRQGISEEIELSKEIPMGLNIINENGPVLFTKSFSPEWIADDNLIGALISAFRSFSGEIFSETFDRAKFGEYYILIKTDSPILFCYIFKGQSYSATQKLNEFTNKLKENPDVWEKLQQYIKVNEVFSQLTFPAFNKILTDVFI